MSIRCFSLRCVLFRTILWDYAVFLQRCSRFSCLLAWQVSLRDLRTFKIEHEFDAYSGSLSDFDVHGNLLAACGFSSRGLNGLSCDRFLMVYDLRMMRAVTPLQVHVDPLFLRFIPTYTSRLAIISQTGTSLPSGVLCAESAEVTAWLISHM